MPSQPTPSQPTSLATTVYRLTVMVGFLGCGSLAAVHYGPEAGDLAEMIDGAATLVMEVPEASKSLPAADVVVFETGSGAQSTVTVPPVSPPPRFDPAVKPASASQPVAAAAVEPLEQARLTAPLLTAGATRAEISPWGAMYRATATVPVGDRATGLNRQFDALGGTPEQAVAKVEQEIRGAYLR